eukprot:284817946_6
MPNTLEDIAGVGTSTVIANVVQATVLAGFAGSQRDRMFDFYALLSGILSRADSSNACQGTPLDPAALPTGGLNKDFVDLYKRYKTMRAAHQARVDERVRRFFRQRSKIFRNLKKKEQQSLLSASTDRADGRSSYLLYIAGGRQQKTSLRTLVWPSKSHVGSGTTSVKSFPGSYQLSSLPLDSMASLAVPKKTDVISPKPWDSSSRNWGRCDIQPAWSGHMDPGQLLAVWGYAAWSSSPESGGCCALFQSGNQRPSWRILNSCFCHGCSCWRAANSGPVIYGKWTWRCPTYAARQCRREFL